MIVYIAVCSISFPYEKLAGADILASYYYCRNNPKLVEQIPKMRNFLLDSGIFTFISQGVKVNMDDYLHRYAEFVRENRIRDYVELDVDQLYGVSETRRIRDKLENLVGWRSIPVWHTIRGKESFIEDCKEYDRICLGYFLTEGLKTKTTEKYAPYFIDTAHKHKCKIHGLGFTKNSLLTKLHFDSVDSSSWAVGHRYGQYVYFDKKTCQIKTQLKPAGTVYKSLAQIQEYSFGQWRLYQDYALGNL